LRHIFKFPLQVTDSEATTSEDELSDETMDDISSKEDDKMVEIRNTVHIFVS
jgi:hypothetical protein